MARQPSDDWKGKAELDRVRRAIDGVAAAETDADRTTWLSELRSAVAALSRVMRAASERLTYSVEEAAEKLGISRAYAYECVKAGDIPSVMMGRRILVPVSALHRLIDPDDEPEEGERNRVGL